MFHWSTVHRGSIGIPAPAFLLAPLPRDTHRAAPLHLQAPSSGPLGPRPPARPPPSAQACVEKGKVSGLMCSYNEVNPNPNPNPNPSSTRRRRRSRCTKPLRFARALTATSHPSTARCCPTRSRTRSAPRGRRTNLASEISTSSCHGLRWDVTRRLPQTTRSIWLAKIGADTAENEQNFAEFLTKLLDVTPSERRFNCKVCAVQLGKDGDTLLGLET